MELNLQEELLEGSRLEVGIQLGGYSSSLGKSMAGWNLGYNGMGMKKEGNYEKRDATEARVKREMS